MIRIDRLGILMAGMGAFYFFAQAGGAIQSQQTAATQYVAEMKEFAFAGKFDPPSCHRNYKFMNECLSEMDAGIARLTNSNTKLRNMQPPECMKELHTEVVSAMTIETEAWGMIRQAVANHSDQEAAAARLHVAAEAIENLTPHIKPAVEACR
jgi:hypothetical protein